MHQIEPYERWLTIYNPSLDERSPFYGKEYNFDLYSENIYGYYIDPAWDFIGSETLYVKILYANYQIGAVIIECFGEWNDTLNNDIMFLKRNLVELLEYEGIDKFILIGENVLNFHGPDDSYYEDWFEDIPEGWIAGIGFQDFVKEEMAKYNVDSYINMGGQLDVPAWRTFQPIKLIEYVHKLITYRLEGNPDED